MILILIYIIFIMVTMFLIVKDKKGSKKNEKMNKGNKKTALLIVLCTMLAYYLIGYILNTDVLNVFTLKENGISFSFIGMILLFITYIALRCVIDIIKKLIGE